MANNYKPDVDKFILEEDSINYFDFEFENYTFSKDILKDLILDEIILTNCKEARKVNRDLRKQNPKGILEKIFERYKIAEHRKINAAFSNSVNSKSSTKDVILSVEGI